MRAIPKASAELFMDAYQAIITKRDTRHYTGEPIAEDVLTRILQAGRMAGSSKNTQPVRMVVVRDSAIREELANCGDFSKPVRECSAAIAIALGTGGGSFDAGRTAQNLMVAAWAEGVTSCPISMHRPECAARVLQLPAGHSLAIVIALGYPDRKHPLSGGRQRLPLDELIHWDRWSD